MAEPKAQYSFLPWFRRGIIGLQDSADIPASAQVNIPIKLDIIPEGKAVAKIEKAVSIYGPGDIIGIDRKMIVRTIPRNGTKTFEANFLCGIEFFDEDFAWRYTPGKNKVLQLQPWIWLAALQTEEFTRIPVASAPLPVIEITANAMNQAFPDPAGSWAWAHTHLNFSLDGATIKDKRDLVLNKLEENPELGCSRLLCPRRLKPLTRYTVFLIPAFEKGRLAGIGSDSAEIEAIPNAQPSWKKENESASRFPVYFEWQFTTHSAGDFESLAKQLSPLSQEEYDRLQAAGKTMDIRDPGWGIRHTRESRSLTLESALYLADTVLPKRITEEPAPDDKKFVADISSLINLGVSAYLDGSTATAANPWFADADPEDDPFVVPPLYGAFYRKSNAGKTDATGMFTIPAQKNWYNQVNLNPVYRIGSSQGTFIVQQDQEKLMDRAWDQRQAGFAKQQLVERWHYSAVLSQQLFMKRIDPLISDATADDDKTWSALSFMAPMNRYMEASGKNFTTALQERTFPDVFTGSFKKMISKNKKVKQRTRVTKHLIDVAPPIGGPTILVSRGEVSAIDLAVAIDFFNPIGVMTFFRPDRTDTLFKVLKKVSDAMNMMVKGHILSIRFGRESPMELKDAELIQAGYAGFTPCRTAISKLVRLFGPVSPPIRPNVFTNQFLYKQMHAQITPAVTIPLKVKVVAGLSSTEELPVDWTKPSEPGPQFPEPMFKPLANHSTDYILPGLSEIPVDRVVLMSTNQAFIESYLLGLNHEIAREFLWREFPAPLNGTPFRQFWDTRNIPDAEQNPALYKDIKPIQIWENSEIGKNSPGSAGDGKVVVLIRGELFRKYPYTEVFMQKSNWITKGVHREPAGEDTRVFPIFSAQIDPDYHFFGFDVKVDVAIGAGDNAGYYFGLRERAGEIQFGLDVSGTANNPSWQTIEKEVPENVCISADGVKFKSLQTNPSLKTRSDGIASLLFQRPYMLFVHAARLVEQK